MSLDHTTLVSAQRHDIKNEMQVMQNLQDELVEFLAGQLRGLDVLNNLQKHSQALSQRLVELLSMLKLQNGDFQVNEDEHWLVDSLTPWKQSFERFEALTIHLPDDDEFSAYYDEQLLLIALNNIAMNALQAKATELWISISSQDQSWSLICEDNGNGFDDTALEDQKMVPQGTQSGLGLYLISQVIEAHKRGNRQGLVRLENGDRGGAKVSLNFP